MAGFSIYVEGIANRIVILDVRYERKRSISFQNVRLEQLEGLSCQLLALGIQCEKRPGSGGGQGQKLSTGNATFDVPVKHLNEC